MNPKLFTELGGALQRVAELSQKSIIESGDASEKRALEKFISDSLAANAAELLGCWQTVQSQYIPLVQGFTGLMRHVGAILGREAAPAAAAEPAAAADAVTEAEPSNVVQLNPKE